ncbi:WD domain G-beta repeat domain-containing protein [Phytophthora infestans]|uniref:WD domain G-beta repeat domain-containing protein n=1 Tax=Phytophthora infestans TaxID=4787 RepID=A0A8S9UDN4_PHYIN|nr:WD domain G-beta repeat domain-containing protein [Phytophthora infestans]
MPQHNDVLYLVAQYLQAAGLYASSLVLQEESGLDVTWLRGYSHEVALLRRWIFAGDVTRARALLQPLTTFSDVSNELKTALLALDELEIMIKTRFRGDTTRLAQAKLKCFESLVPLFRAPVDTSESDVFKYVAMPKLQLKGLIRDALNFHMQDSGDTARDCVSVSCTDVETVHKEEHDNSEMLILDEPHLDVNIEEDKDVPGVAHSVERWQKRQRNLLALSMNLSGVQWQEDSGEVDGEEHEGHSIENTKETADAAVNCELDLKEMVDVTVSCALDVKNTVDAGVNCTPEKKETADVAVSCGPNEWSDVATQTDTFNENNMVLEDSNDGDVSNNSIATNAKTKNNGLQGNDVVAVETQTSFEDLQQGEQKQTQQVLTSNSVKDDTASWTQQSSSSLQLNSYLENEPVQPQMLTDSPDLEQQGLIDESVFDAEIPMPKRPPQHYNELKLDHVVCADVIAEVKEPQAVRALDVHPTGNHLAVGTNARALRVFNLSTPLQQRQEQLSWSSPLNSILPLLPVSLERHKHHDSGIYCVAYNHHLRNSNATSMIASGAADGSVKVLVTTVRDPVQRQQVDEFWIQRGDINGAMGKIRALKFSSSHLLWTTSTYDRRLCCWDIQRAHRSSKSSPFQTLDGHVGEIQTIAMPYPLTSASPSTLLLSAALDKTVRLWDTRSRRCERLVTSGVHAAFALDFHPNDDTRVVSGHQDGNISLWDLRSTAREALQTLASHQNECRSVRWSPGGQWLLSAAFDGTLCIMQVSSSSLQPVASYHKHSGKVLQAQWHPTEPAFVSSGADKRVKLWAFA